MGRNGIRVGRAVLAAVVGALAATLAAGPALAHNALSSSDPRDGARLAKAPAAVRLTFLARLDTTTTKVTVTGPDGASAAAGRPTFDRATVRVPLRAGAAGLYTVAYEVASDDGHPVRGRIRFTLTVAATPAATPPASESPATAAAAPSLTPAASQADDGGTRRWPWLAAGAAVALLAGVGARARRRR